MILRNRVGFEDFSHKVMTYMSLVILESVMCF